MLWFVVEVAQAAELEGELFGKAFQVGAALGLTDPAQPGTLSVLVTSERLTCDKARQMRSATAAGQQQTKKPPAMLVAAFTAVEEGSLAATVMTLGPKGLGALGGTVTLAAVPSNVGETGYLQVALAATPGSREGAFGGMVASADTDALKGRVGFELCDALLPRPSLGATVFESTKLHVSERSMFPENPPSEMDLQVALPTGWSKGESQLGTAVWTAPDGLTKLSIDLETPSEPFESSKTERVDSQVQAFQTDATQGELVVGKVAAENAFVARWRYRWGTGPWTNTLDVFRQGPGWPYAVKCSVVGSDTAVTEVFDAAEAACVALTHAP